MSPSTTLNRTPDTVDAALITMCNEFVVTVSARDECRSRRQSDEPAQELHARARELLDDMLRIPANSAGGRAARMRALRCIQRPGTEFETLIDSAEDWFGQIAAAVLRDVANETPSSEEPAATPAPGLSKALTPFGVMLRRARAHARKTTEEQSAFRCREEPETMTAAKHCMARSEDAEGFELLMGDLMPYLPCVTMADVGAQVGWALDLLFSLEDTDEPTGDHLKGVIRCLCSAIAVLRDVSEHDLSSALGPYVLSRADEYATDREALWAGSCAAFPATCDGVS